MKQGRFGAFLKMLYSRMFLPPVDGHYQSRRALDNDILGLPVEDLDEATTATVKIMENGGVAHSH